MYEYAKRCMEGTKYLMSCIYNKISDSTLLLESSTKLQLQMSFESTHYFYSLFRKASKSYDMLFNWNSVCTHLVVNWVHVMCTHGIYSELKKMSETNNYSVARAWVKLIKVSYFTHFVTKNEYKQHFTHLKVVVRNKTHSKNE